MGWEKCECVCVHERESLMAMKTELKDVLPCQSAK